MQIKMSHEASYALAYCVMDVGESLLVERDGMVQMSAGVDVSGGIGPGGAVKSMVRKSLGRESFFMGRYRANHHGAWVAVAPKWPGDMSVIDLDRLSGIGVLVEAGALVACAGPGPATNGVDVDVRWAGMQGILMREGATMLHLTGSSLALIGSYGGIDAISLQPGETRIIDTGHVVGFTDNIKPRVGPLGGIISSATSGEGLVAEVVGPQPSGGVVWTQTRSEQSLRSWLFPTKSQNTRSGS